MNFELKTLEIDGNKNFQQYLANTDTFKTYMALTIGSIVHSNTSRKYYKVAIKIESIRYVKK